MTRIFGRGRGIGQALACAFLSLCLLLAGAAGVLPAAAHLTGSHPFETSARTGVQTGHPAEASALLADCHDKAAAPAPVHAGDGVHAGEGGGPAKLR